MSDVPDPIHDGFLTWLATCFDGEVPEHQRVNLEAAYFAGVSVAMNHKPATCVLSTMAHIRRRNLERRQ